MATLQSRLNKFKLTPIITSGYTATVGTPSLSSNSSYEDDERYTSVKMERESTSTSRSNSVVSIDLSSPYGMSNFSAIKVTAKASLVCRNCLERWTQRSNSEDGSGCSARSSSCPFCGSRTIVRSPSSTGYTPVEES